MGPMAERYPGPLHIACEQGSLEVVHLLLCAGMEVDVSYERIPGATPLQIASAMGHLGICCALLESGADPDARSCIGSYPLLHSCCPRHLPIIKSMLELPGLQQPELPDLQLPLLLALKLPWLPNGYPYTALSCDASEEPDAAADLRDATYTPLLVAARYGHAAIVHTLLSAGASHDRGDINGNLPIHIAALYNHLPIVAMLIESGVNPSCPNVMDEATTSLHLACRRGHVEMVRTLLTAGAFTGARDANKETPIVVACRMGFLEVVDALLKAGADVEEDGLGLGDMTPLMWASAFGQVEVVRRLLEANADVHALGGAYRTAMEFAAGHTEVVALLAAAGGELPSDEGASPVFDFQEEVVAYVPEEDSAPPINFDLGL
eukprot:gene21658-28674_t